MPVEEVHHVVPVHADPSREFDLSNVEGICAEHHAAEHRVRVDPPGTAAWDERLAALELEASK